MSEPKKDEAKFFASRQAALAVLANVSLYKNEAPEPWTKEDLVNVALVFQSVAHSLSWTSDRLAGLSIEQRCLLAEEFGKSIRQSVELFTGIDLSDLILDTDVLEEKPNNEV